MQTSALPRFTRIGLLGGVGARTSAAFHQRLIERCAFEGANHDAAFPSVLHLSEAMPGIDETGVVDEARLLNHFMTAMPVFKAAGVDLLVPVCNSLHPYRGWLSWASGARVLTPVDAVTAAFKESGATSALVLESRSMAASKTYLKALAAVGVTCLLVPAELQQRIDRLIAGLIGGGPVEGEPELLALIGNCCPRGGAVVLGCTELSLWRGSFAWPCVDSSEALVTALLKEAL